MFSTRSRSLALALLTLSTACVLGCQPPTETGKLHVAAHRTVCLDMPSMPSGYCLMTKRKASRDFRPEDDFVADFEFEWGFEQVLRAEFELGSERPNANVIGIFRLETLSREPVAEGTQFTLDYPAGALSADRPSFLAVDLQSGGGVIADEKDYICLDADVCSAMGTAIEDGAAVSVTFSFQADPSDPMILESVVPFDENP